VSLQSSDSRHVKANSFIVIIIIPYPVTRHRDLGHLNIIWSLLPFKGGAIPKFVGGPNPSLYLLFLSLLSSLPLSYSVLFPLLLEVLAQVRAGVHKNSSEIRKHTKNAVTHFPVTPLERTLVGMAAPRNDGPSEWRTGTVDPANTLVCHLYELLFRQNGSTVQEYTKYKVQNIQKVQVIHRQKNPMLVINKKE